MHHRVKSIPILATLAAVVTAALLAGCGGGSDGGGSGGGIGGSDASGTKGDSGSGPVKVGVLATLEGPFAPLGEGALRGVKVALLEHGGKLEGTKATDGVSGVKAGGRAIEISVESSDATPDVALEKERKLVEQDGVAFTVGPLSGDEGLAIKDYAKQHPERTFINGTSAAQNTTLRSPASNFFRFSPDGAQWIAGLGTYVAKDLGYRRIATMAEDYSFPYDQVGGFLTQYCGQGGKVAKRVWVPLGTKDYASYIQQIPKDVDAVFVQLSGADAVNFVKQFDQFVGRKLPIIGGTITVDPTTLKSLGSRAEGIVSAGPVPAALPTAEWRSFAANYKKAFPDATPPGLFETLYYIETTAALKALDQVGGDLSGDQAKFKAALAKLAWKTPIGPVHLDQNRQAIANNYLFKVTGGQNKLFKTIPQVDQTLGMPREAYIEQPEFDRTHPTC